MGRNLQVIIGIDPGKNGGIAYGTSLHDVTSMKYPETVFDFIELLESVEAYAARRPITTYLEKVGGYTGKPQPGSYMFNFGFMCGEMSGVLSTKKIPLIYVTPQTWQKKLGLGNAAGLSSKTQWKNKLKLQAQRAFPSQKVTLATADALLIYQYALVTTCPSE